ncbi:TetR/AcrR family transcriptional regulator [Petropleomorpha daqingensis]|uniref:AcrR family transcriptional regulator n=1 Tax=Petropleomorpha daqingensis TaxID=2026353 RepID=A0A853CCI9_9ACTN|nr:AcrR family transcriptional regulator [Petropleomorpha daqingensis]
MSGTPDWRAQKREETHQRIYDTGMRLFAERGFDRVSVGDIAREAKVSVPTFYAHFENKEHIVMQMPAQEEIDTILSAQPTDVPLAERIRSGIMAWINHYGPEEREQLLQRWRIVVATPGLRNQAATFERATAGLVSDALKADAEPGSSPVAMDVVVTASLSAYTQIILRWAEAGGTLSLEEVAEDVLNALREL